METHDKFLKTDKILSLVKAAAVYSIIAGFILGLLLFVTGCGVTVKQKGETHHYIHVDGETKHTVNTTSDIHVVVSLEVDQIVELCKQAEVPEDCITNSINQLSSSLESLKEELDGVNQDKSSAQSAASKPKCNNDFCKSEK
jgi:hypothetical protein